MRSFFLNKRAVAASTGFFLAGVALAADLVLGPDEAYFEGWTFNVSANPRGCADANILAGDDVITGSLGALAYTVEALGATQAAPASTTGWVDCQWASFGGNIPAGNNTPSPIYTAHARTARLLHTFSGSLPQGSLLLMQDFDGDERTEITFRNCSGDPIDASGFDWLQVSAPSASHHIPDHTPGATWHVVSTTTGNSANETSAIVIRSSEVCQIETNSAKTGGGGHHFFYGIPPVVNAPEAGTFQPVPSLGQWAVLLMSSMLGLFGFARLRSGKSH